MFPFFALIPPTLFVILLVVAIYGIAAWRRRRVDDEADPGIGTVRRLYFYIVSFVALMMASNGIVLLIRTLLDSAFGGPLVTSSNITVAAGISLTIIGLPLWGFHWWFMQRTVSRMPVETRSLLRKFYIYVVLGVSIGLTLNAAVELLQWAFQSRGFTAYHIGAALVWVPVWFFHWRLEQTEGQPSEDTLGIRRLYIYLVSLAGLIMLAGGLGRTVQQLIQSGYDALVSTSVILPAGSGLWRQSVREMLAVGIVGALVWAAHWLYFARKDYGSWLRQVYLYLFAVLGGIVTILVALGLTINNVFTWFLGVSNHSDASIHFNFLPGAVAVLAVGIGLWSYHWLVAQREAEFSLYESRSAQRVYSYILSAIGLGTVSIGILALVTAVWGVLIGVFSDVIAGRDLWREPLAASLTLAIIGLPLWGYYWTKVQKSAQDPDSGDLSSLSRRVFIFGTLVVGVLSVLGSASTLLFFLLRDALGAGLDLGTLRDVRAPLSIIAAAVFFLVYYWGVYRHDRAQGPEAEQAPPIVKDVTMLIGAGGEDLVGRLENALGYNVRTMLWTDPDTILPDLTEEACQEVARRVGAASGSRVLIIPQDQSLRVLSYR